MLVHRVMDHLLSQVAVFQNGENGPNALPLVMQDSGMELKFELMVKRLRKVYSLLSDTLYRYIILPICTERETENTPIMI